MANNTFCTKCRKFAKKVEYDQKARTHRRGYGCREGEPLLTVAEVPAPEKKVVTFDKANAWTKNTGPINSMFGALQKAGLVKVESRP